MIQKIQKEQISEILPHRENRQITKTDKQNNK